MEFQAFVFENAPDLIILNETWLKPSISSSEILPGKSYKIFRIDRSTETHPPDLDNPKKFKKSGGGVLIAVKSSSNLCPKLIIAHAKLKLLQLRLPYQIKRN